nr:MAG TPA: hypothetical protein [Caudoviricetes sp.]
MSHFQHSCRFFVENFGVFLCSFFPLPPCGGGIFHGMMHYVKFYPKTAPQDAAIPR